MISARVSTAMQRIYLFTPDNDLALANGTGSYAAPPVARRMARDLSCIAAWLAKPGDAVVAHDERQAEWLTRHARQWGLDIEVLLPPELASIREATFCPWGWSAYQRKRLLGLGVREELLPSPEHIATLRALSHRRTSAVIHTRFAHLTGERCCPAPEECFTLGEVLAFAARHGGVVAKSPWSSSGRGVMSVHGTPQRDFRQWCSGALKRQGSVMCEEFFDVVCDFAVEFESRGREVSLGGLSVFTSDAHHQYAHGMIGTPEQLTRHLKELFPRIGESIEAIRQVATEVVSPHYDGLFGIDMMLYRSGGEICLNPCVELNLRPTMGAVTAALGRVMPPSVEHGWQFAVMRNEQLRGLARTNATLRLTPDSNDAQWAAACLPPDAH